MIIQLKNQAEYNAILVGLRCLTLVMEDDRLVLSSEEATLESVLGFNTDEPVTVDNIRAMAMRIDSGAVICSGCETEFTSPFDSVLCPDCSKNQESKNA